MNKATERLKEIEDRLNELKSNQKPSMLDEGAIFGLEREKQGILLGLQEGRKDMIKRIEKLNIYQEHESCIAIDKKDLQELKKEMNVER